MMNLKEREWKEKKLSPEKEKKEKKEYMRQAP